jgi:hypothetical protein
MMQYIISLFGNSASYFPVDIGNKLRHGMLKTIFNKHYEIALQLFDRKGVSRHTWGVARLRGAFHGLSRS